MRLSCGTCCFAGCGGNDKRKARCPGIACGRGNAHSQSRVRTTQWLSTVSAWMDGLGLDWTGLDWTGMEWNGMEWNGPMDRWIDGWTDGWIDGWLGAWSLFSCSQKEAPKNGHDPRQCCGHKQPNTQVIRGFGFNIAIGSCFESLTPNIC